MLTSYTLVLSKTSFIALTADCTIDKLKGQLGEGRSDIIRTIVIAYLSEKGHLRGDESEP